MAQRVDGDGQHSPSTCTLQELYSKRPSPFCAVDNTLQSAGTEGDLSSTTATNGENPGEGLLKKPLTDGPSTWDFFFFLAYNGIKMINI